MNPDLASDIRSGASAVAPIADAIGTAVGAGEAVRIVTDRRSPLRRLFGGEKNPDKKAAIPLTFVPAKKGRFIEGESHTEYVNIPPDVLQDIANRISTRYQAVTGGQIREQDLTRLERELLQHPDFADKIRKGEITEANLLLPGLF